MPGTRHYCTLFDRRYAARAIALYRSLERCAPAFVLRALCMDDESRELLGRLSLEHLQPIPIERLEEADPELRAVRPTRSSYEYCWTCTAALCRYVLASEPELEMLTYLDADLHFSSSPEPLFDELGEDSVLLIPHRNSPEMERSVGRYNVGWLTFRNDANARAALDWWRERCVEWCYERVEPERYGDQKYLDQLPTRFPGVRVSTRAGAGLAPWNQTRHAIAPGTDGAPPSVDGEPLIYFHQAGLRVHQATPLLRALAGVSSVFRFVPGPVGVVFALATEPASPAVERIWWDYVEDLTHALGELAAVTPRTLALDRPNPRLAARSIVVRMMPLVLADAYRRLPIRARDRVWRWFASL